MTETLPLAYATCSIGHGPDDTLPAKLKAISQAGFKGIELSFPDILAYGNELLGHQVSPNNYEELVKVSKEIRQLCQSNKLTVMMLQPFAHLEGWPRGSPDRDDAFKRAKCWISIMDAVGTDLLQVGSTDIPRERLSADAETSVIEDLRELCDMLDQHGHKRLAYENWCWSTHAPTWKNAWEVVRAVDRPNIGLCLDTFQTAGSEWADPTTESGLIEDLPRETLEKSFQQSMRELGNMVPASKIYLLQISDAYKPSKPLATDDTTEGQRPRARWSSRLRPMPYDGGYLPIESVTKAVLATGFRGWFSMEIFDKGPDGVGRRDISDMGSFAQQAMRAMKKLLDQCSE
ncbi:putative 3-dehydroshikimate dehydratase [Aspergillus campestris IBT 28561]|uniref:3-dehydroshikimate dehydratase n=1 Tax=Aspergillus campestris (strain IBT 28561) TaxID=1392248 RepID=A0A2I1CZV4_ASPC2|nr:putative 3-dehydroshikimate dehydratase [Aspergillus campestris IBT 28561]PKY03167.1 putative 3-dehydroshikimate dehydratase [Aspergillus campestris IBT 28561]